MKCTDPKCSRRPARMAIQNYGATDVKKPNSAVEFYRVGFTIERLSRKSAINFFLAILCLLHVIVNVVCFVINCYPKDFRHRHGYTFHLLEFWATFAFSIVSLSSFIFSRKPLNAIHNNPTSLKLLLFANIVFSGVPAFLITIDIHTFEVMSHEMEYVVGLLQAIMDIIVFNLIVQKDHFQIGPFFFFGMALIQIITYNFCDNGEQISHFFEFIFEICTATVMFCFCVDNKFFLDGLLCSILHEGTHCMEHCDLIL